MEISAQQSLDSNIATAIIFLIALAGTVSNILALVTLRINPTLKSSFGLLCLSYCIANLGVMLVFMFWVTPMTLRQSTLSTGRFGKIFGQVIIFFWDVCVYTHLVISINRFVAISMPYRAKSFLTTKCTCILTAIVWLISFCHVIPYFWEDTCYVVYDTELWVWVFADTPCGHAISHYTDLYTGCTWCAVKLVLDSITAIKIKMNNKMHAHGTCDALRRSRRKVEIRFFIQAVVQGSIFLCGMISFYFVCQLFTDKWGVFITATLPWESCHAIDGFVMVLFHFRLAHLRSKRKDSQQKRSNVWASSGR